MKKLLVFISLLLAYILLGSVFHIYIFCPINEFTGLHCPGCGITRMLLSILKLDFYQAFRYNPLLFVMFPFFIFLLIDEIISEFKNKKSILKKIPNKYTYTFIFVLILYGILRNIIPYLAPTTI